MFKARATTDVRKALEAKREPLRKTIAQLEKLPAAKEAAAKAVEEQSAYLNGPSRHNADDRDRRIALSAEVSRTRAIVQAIEGEPIRAQRELQRIELLLGADAEASRLKKELAVVAADGRTAEKRVVALRAALEAISAQRDQVEGKATRERTDAAERAFNARVEGKLAPAVTASSTAAELESLDAERAVAQRQLTAATEKLHTLSEQGKAVLTNLARALFLASEVDRMQAVEDVRPTFERHAAFSIFAGLGPLYGEALEIPLNELLVQQLVNELGAEYRCWEPAEVGAAPAPADADAEQTAEPGAQAAAA